jgi:hypothetical protein
MTPEEDERLVNVMILTLCVFFVPLGVIKFLEILVWLGKYFRVLN